MKDCNVCLENRKEQCNQHIQYLVEQRKEECKTCIDRIYRLSEYYKGVLSSSEKYTNTVFSIAYAVFLTLFIKFEYGLTDRIRDLVLILFSVSLLCFVVNEILKMRIEVFRKEGIQKILLARPSGFNRAIIALDSLAEKKALFFNTYIWPFLFCTSLVTGLLSAILFIGYFYLKYYS